MDQLNALDFQIDQELMSDEGAYTLDQVRSYSLLLSTLDPFAHPPIS